MNFDDGVSVDGSVKRWWISIEMLECLTDDDVGCRVVEGWKGRWGN